MYQQPGLQPQSSFPAQTNPQQVANAHYAQLHPSFQHHRFLIRRKFWKFFGAATYVFSDSMQPILYSKLKAFKLKEDITIFENDTQTKPLIRIRARHIIDLAATYDVFDVSAGGEMHLGALKRKGLKSLLRDEWEIWNTQDQPIGLIQEDNETRAVIRRFIGGIVNLLMPQAYNFYVYNLPAGTMAQTFNPFLMRMTADFSPDVNGYFDRRLAAAAATLLCLIEGKQT